MNQYPHVPRLSRILPVILACLFSFTAEAKLLSSSYQEDKCKEEIDRIFRETRLNEGQSFWGERYREEIERTTVLFGKNYYTVFSELGLSAAMARCAVFAKYESDYQKWLGEMDRFDRAAEELDRQDKARYYFAKGLAVLQSIPDKISDVPAGFYKAAENGFSSGVLAEYVTRGDKQRMQSGFAARIFLNLAESYKKGEVRKEAFKFYFLSAESGLLDPETFLKLAECASLEGADLLAYKIAVLFLVVFNPYDGARDGRDDILSVNPAHAGMSADDFWTLCRQSLLDDILSRSRRPAAAQKQPVKPRNLDKFETRYIQPLARYAGAHDDLFEMDLCDLYWTDSTIVKRFLPRISGGIDSHDGAVAEFAGRLAADPLYGKDPDVAFWEARRWKTSGKLQEFAEKYPDRYKLSGIDRRKESE